MSTQITHTAKGINRAGFGVIFITYTIVSVLIVKFDLESLMDQDVEDLLNQVSERIREIRLKRNLSQEDFDTSEPQGISVPAIAAIEGKRKKNIELRTLLRFCRRAGVHPREVFNFSVPWDAKAVTKAKLKHSRAPRKSRKP